MNTKHFAEQIAKATASLALLAAGMPAGVAAWSDATSATRHYVVASKDAITQSVETIQCASEHATSLNRDRTHAECATPVDTANADSALIAGHIPAQAISVPTRFPGVSLTSAPMAAFYGADNASNSPYANGWQSGDNGGYGFGPWILYPYGDGGGPTQFLVASSTTNGNAIDSNHDGDIDTAGGKSWGLYGFSYYYATARRGFDHPLISGSVFTIAMDNGSESWTIVNLENGGGNSLLEIYRGPYNYYANLQPIYGASTTLEGVVVVVTVTSSSTYQTSVRRLVDGATGFASGNLKQVTGDTQIALLEISDTGSANSDINRDRGYFNSISYSAFNNATPTSTPTETPIPPTLTSTPTDTPTTTPTETSTNTPTLTPTSTNTPTVTPMPTNTPTPTPMPPAIIFGVVRLQGHIAPATGGTITLEDMSGFFMVANTFFEAGTGVFAAEVPALSGGTTYTLTASHDLYLASQKSITVFPAGSYLQPTTSLRSGDANNNGEVDVADLSCVGGSFGEQSGICGASGSADVNADGAVNIFDLVLTGGNYGLTGPMPW